MTRRTRNDLTEILGRTVGTEPARAHVARVADSLGIADDVSAAQALAILEVLAGEAGIVGIAARFAKARIHLAWQVDAPDRDGPRR